MKATQLIAELQKLVDYNEDVEVLFMYSNTDEESFQISVEEAEYNELNDTIILS